MSNAARSTIEPKLAYANGQCHGLALALQEAQGWQPVARKTPAGVVEHVCVEHPDRGLVDIYGLHDPAILVGQRTAEPIDRDGIQRLVSEHDWAPPQVDEARTFVPGVLEAIERGPQGGVEIEKIGSLQVIEDVELLVEWHGDIYLRLWVRETGSLSTWFLYSALQFPKDDAGRCVVDFRRERLFAYAASFDDNQFDLTKAHDKIENRVLPKPGSELSHQPEVA